MDEREACDLQEQPVFEQPQDETAPQQTEDEPSDDPVMPKGQVGKLLLLCLLVAVGGTAAALCYFHWMGYFAA